MVPMDYIELTCKLDPLEPWREILIAQLADIGFDSFEETYDGLKAYVLESVFNDKQFEDAVRLPAAETNPIVSLHLSDIKGINWNQEWERHFQAVWIKDRVLIRAPFHDAEPKAEFEVIIEPKMSFGTGHHETTRLVIEWMLECDFRGLSVLDMGCGTGVLAIFAAKKGARTVTAIDNYVFAFENSCDNVQRNGFPDIVTVKHGDASLLGDESYDKILANITRNVLLEDLPTYYSVLNNGGELFLSGFLATDRDMIVDRASALGLRFIGEKHMQDWVAVRMKKP
jgi:ribosomal protein L11 methyltransferase